MTSVLIAVGLAMDSFAVSLGVGTAGQARDLRQKFRLAFHLSLFQGGMVVLGWLAGFTIVSLIEGFDHWVAMALLGYVGGKMIKEGLDPESAQYEIDPSRGRLLIILCVATSIDALAVGLSMAMLEATVFVPSLIVGAVTFLLSSVGLFAGSRLGERFGKNMEILGGLILIGIGLRVVFSHLWG